MAQKLETAEKEEPPSSLCEISETNEEPPDLSSTSISLPIFRRSTPDRPTILPFPIHRRHLAPKESKSRAFRKKFYPAISSKEWNSWHWQVANRIRTADRLRSMIALSDEEERALAQSAIKLPFAVTPYYMSLIPADDPLHPIRRAVVPTEHELFKGPGEEDDPLGEDNQSPVHGLIHRYPDRVLFLVHDFCSTYCRYCTRSRVVGHGSINASQSRLEKAIQYISQTPTIRDVLLSGGDPLLLSDDKLEWLLARLRLIPHVEVIRLGTKIPAVLPQRVTPKLVRMLKRYHPLWMSLHFMHPDECTPETTKACAMLADAGIPLGSQTVLLNGINDTVETMKSLMHGLMKMRVRPYYLYQCDPITGSSHFRTPVTKGLEIIKGLRGHTTGYAVPTYVIDAPGGGGKIPLLPEGVIGREGDNLLLRNFEGRCFRYPDLQ
ncbi:MAG: KamA family radical SAM protein [Proteobacteria bacterium]|nr:KamA family radical SAM protein [Pseudomonadota bacterium]MBU1687352.1 KamA family radical SAM protein [Pseudomonadota bacterium]